MNRWKMAKPRMGRRTWRIIRTVRPVYIFLMGVLLLTALPLLPPVTAKAETEEMVFSDVPQSHFSYDAVQWAVINDITSGVSLTRFGTDAPCTRGQIVTFLWKAAGEEEEGSGKTFSDVSSTHPFAKAIQWAAAKGITSGYPDGRFGIDDPCTRGQIMTFLYHYYGDPTVEAATFSDVSIGSLSFASSSWASHAGITRGVGEGHFAPDQVCTRAQAMTFIYKADKREDSFPTISSAITGLSQTDLPKGCVFLDSAADSLVKKVNLYRAKEGLSAPARTSTMDQMAKARTIEMTATGNTRKRPDGTMYTIALDAGLTGRRWMGEQLTAVKEEKSLPNDPDLLTVGVMEAFRQAEKAKEPILLSPKGEMIGAACFYQPSTRTLYWNIQLISHEKKDEKKDTGEAGEDEEDSETMEDLSEASLDQGKAAVVSAAFLAGDGAASDDGGEGKEPDTTGSKGKGSASKDSEETYRKAAEGFSDVLTGKYYEIPVGWAVTEQVTAGTGKDGAGKLLFSPDAPCTRAQIVTFLWKAAGSPDKGTEMDFADVSPSSSFAKAIAWAKDRGITAGTGKDGAGKLLFSPDSPCTRGQIMTFLWKYGAKETDSTKDLPSSMTDVKEDSAFYGPIAWAMAQGITTGTSQTTFSPDETCSRAQAVTFLYREKLYEERSGLVEREASGVKPGGTPIASDPAAGLARAKAPAHGIFVTGYGEKLLSLVNEERTKAGQATPVTWNEEAAEAARARAIEIIARFSHNRPDAAGDRKTYFSKMEDGTVVVNNSYYTVFYDQGYTEEALAPAAMGENMAYGYTTPASVMEGWMKAENPEHKSYILGTDVSYDGFGAACLYDQDKNVYYWVEIFVKDLPDLTVTENLKSETDTWLRDAEAYRDFLKTYQDQVKKAIDPAAVASLKEDRKARKTLYEASVAGLGDLEKDKADMNRVDRTYVEKAAAALDGMKKEIGPLEEAADAIEKATGTGAKA